MTEKKAINYKIVIVGRSAVGKSSLLLRFTDDRFINDYLTTIGVDFKFRSLKIHNENFKLQIWDTAGQEKYQTITKTFYKDTHAIVLVYDLTSRASFEEAKFVWLEESRKNAEPNTVFILIGNKADILGKTEVQPEEVQKFAEKEGMLSFQCSAKTGQNVETAFFEMTKEIYNRTKKVEELQHKKEEEKLELKQGQQNTQQKNCC